MIQPLFTRMPRSGRTRRCWTRAQTVLRCADSHLQEFFVSPCLLGALWTEDRLAEWASGNLDALLNSYRPTSHWLLPVPISHCARLGGIQMKDNPVFEASSQLEWWSKQRKLNIKSGVSVAKIQIIHRRENNFVPLCTAPSSVFPQEEGIAILLVTLQDVEWTTVKALPAS